MIRVPPWAALLPFLLHAPVFPRVVVTEVHRNPVGSETAIPGGRSHEFVEFVNLGADTLRVSGTWLGDRSDADTLKPYADCHGYHPGCITGTALLPPGVIALVLDPDYDSALALDPSTRFDIADSTRLFTVADGHIGDGGGLSGTEGVWLFTGSPDQPVLLAAAVDSGLPVPPLDDSLYLHSGADAPEGTSVVLTGCLFGYAAYEACPEGVSPGRSELLQSGWLVEERLTALGADACQVTVAVLPPSGTAAGAWSISLSTGDGAQEPVAAEQDSTGVFRAVDTIPLDTVPRRVELHSGSVSIVRPLDISTLWLPDNAVRVTELFPRADSRSPEWFEVRNMCAIPVNLAGWKWGDSEDTACLGTSSLVLQPGHYRVFAKDRAALATVWPTLTVVTEPPSWHTLGNYRDSLTLWDSRGMVHDRVVYDHDWLDDWQAGSLERVYDTGTLPFSWAPAPAPTPGLDNAAASWRAVESPSVDIGPIPFTPNSDGIDDKLAIRCALPAGSSARVRVYAMDGSVVRRFDGVPQRLYLWDGRLHDGRRAPVGPVFVVVDIEDHQGHETRIRKRGILWR